MDIKRRVFDTVRNKRMVKEWYRLHIKSGGDKYPFNMVMPDDTEIKEFMKSIRDYYAYTDLFKIHNDAVRLRRLVPDLKDKIKEYALARIQLDNFLNEIIRKDHFRFDSRIVDCLRTSNCTALFYYAGIPEISMTEQTAVNLNRLYPGITFRQCIEEFNCGDSLKLDYDDLESIQEFVILFCYARMKCRDWRSLSAKSREFIRQRIAKWEADDEQSGRLPF